MTNQKTFEHLTFFLEKQPEFMSILDFDNSNKKIDRKFFESKCSTVFVDSTYNEKGENISDIIFKSNAGFYIYLSREKDYLTNYNIKVLYRDTQRTDALLFVAAALKEKK